MIRSNMLLFLVFWFPLCLVNGYLTYKLELTTPQILLNLVLFWVVAELFTRMTLRIYNNTKGRKE